MTPKRKHDFISVVIPCYNASRYIPDCLDGLAKQTYQQFEVIIVDDGSEDRSEETVKQWMEQRSPFFPIVYSKLPRNIGFAGALTVGYFLSAGEYIAVHDADDISHPERLEKQLSFLRQHPNIALVGTNYAAFPDGHFERQTPANWLAYGRDNIRRVYAEGKHCICHGTIMFRGEVFDRLGGPTRRIHGAEDYEFIVKFVNAKLEIDNLPDILYYYRSHPKQRSRQFYQKGGG
ncbi:glycosyltransferase family 2 protein [Geobacillus subterraneus]|uniref:glycosyltransferase family 2 protein n=1 Tax=Geobacillus subterraneus TaxID=129338 RepID=UPI0035CFB733